MFALAGGALLLAGCDSGTSGQASANPPGTVLNNPSTGLNVVVDANQGGEANRIKMVGSFWGRQVDIYDFDQATSLKTLQFEDFVIGDDIASGINYVLDRNSVTESETLTILHKAGTPSYDAAFAQVEANVQPMLAKSLTAPPPFTAMPRNAALVLVFDDLLDADTITAKNIAVLTGYAPVQPYEARVIPDPSHGDLLDRDGNGVPEFYTTRVLVDMTVSQIESQQSNPPLPVNSLGLPEAQVISQPNVVVRVPTKVVPAIGQLDVLSNLGGSGMSFAANGPNDPTSVTQDVVRAFRSSSGDLGDPNNGFLVDEIAPRVIGVQGVTLSSVVNLPPGSNLYQVDMIFDSPSCAPQPRVGDVIRIGNVALAVVTLPGQPPSGGILSQVNVILQVGDVTTFVSGPAQYLMDYDPVLGVPPECFVRFNPTPTQLPAAGVAPNSTITIRFSEPIDPASVSGFETFAVSRVSNVLSFALSNTIVGTAQASLDLKEYTYSPQIPFERNPGFFPAGEDYRLTLAGGTTGVIDLSGRPLQDALPSFLFRLDPAAAASQTRGFVFKLNTVDEDGNGAPELRGQFLYNLAKGSITPRPVTRFSGVADATQPVLGLQIPFTAPIQTPLSNLGSKMMTLWRYHDLGFGLNDDLTMNLDVEHLAWAPFLGLQVDNYTRFQMRLAHSKFLPDEIINPISLLPDFPLSGLVKTFDQNQVDAINDPLKVVHQKDLGYLVQPVNSFVASTGTLMMPYPLNYGGLTLDQYTRYTWRDTNILAVGGPSGAGVETNINAFALGIPPVKAYVANKVPTIGLPLLMEFRCYPDDAAFGLNGFKINIALNSSARPAFRAFSTGGVLSNGSLFKIDPDNEPIARGGINPATGQSTGPGSEVDPSVYLGQADFVVRVNRVHTVWLDTVQFTAQFQTPLVEPSNSLQPLGTSVVIALRSSPNVTNGTPAAGQPIPRSDATKYDAYGDPKAAALVTGTTNFQVTFPLVNNVPDNSWKVNMGTLNALGGTNLRFVQARITMVSNPVTLLTPEVSGFGISLRY